jgi:hypothetical protein
LASAFLAACGGGSNTPVTPTIVPTPAPEARPSPEAVVSPSPSPSPTPAADVDPNSEPPNLSTPVKRFTIRVFWIQDKNGNLRSYKEGDVIRVGETIRFDSQGKDENNQPTAGSGDLPRWDWGPDEVAMLSGPRTFNPRAAVLKAGEFRVESSLDDVPSNVMHFVFED